MSKSPRLWTRVEVPTSTVIIQPLNSQLRSGNREVKDRKWCIVPFLFQYHSVRIQVLGRVGENTIHQSCLRICKSCQKKEGNFILPVTKGSFYSISYFIPLSFFREPYIIHEFFKVKGTHQCVGDKSMEDGNVSDKENGSYSKE